LSIFLNETLGSTVVFQDSARILPGSIWTTII